MLEGLANLVFRLFLDRHVGAQMPAEGRAVRPSSFRDTPRTRLAGVEPGRLVKIVGTSRPTGELLDAPDGGEPCVARAVLAQNRQSMAWWAMTPWRRVESAACTFELVDEEAAVLVVASRVDVLGAHARSRPTRFGAPVQKDTWILPGERIAVLGRLTNGTPQPAEGYRDGAADTRFEAVALTDDETCFHLARWQITRPCALPRPGRHVRHLSHELVAGAQGEQVGLTMRRPSAVALVSRFFALALRRRVATRFRRADPAASGAAPRGGHGLGRATGPSNPARR